MAKYIGRLIGVGFGKESVRGTAVDVTKWLNKTEYSFEDKIETVLDEASISSIVDSNRVYVTKTWAEGDLGMYADVNQLGWLLLSLLGAPTSGVATTGAYLHTYNLVETNQTQSLTIGMDDPTEGDKRFANCVIDSFTLSVDAAQIATVSVTFKGQTSTATTHTVTYGVDYKLLARHAIFKTAANLAGLDAANAVSIRSFEITINKNVEDDMNLGSITPSDFVNKQFSIEGSFTLLFTSTTFKDYAIAGTQRAVRFELTDTNTTIGVSSNPSLVIDLPAVGLTEFAKDQANNEVVAQTLNFKGVRSFADASAIVMKLVNTTTSY